jgi:serine protease AprX
MISMSCFVAAQNHQQGSYWIYLRSPKTSTSQFQSPVFARSLDVSERALTRRSKTLPPDRLIDELDYPVSPSALEQIQNTGVKIRTVSRWFNAVSVEATPQQLHALITLPIVAATESVALLKRLVPPPATIGVAAPALPKSSNIAGLDYGSSATQLSNMKAVNLHALGVNGSGVLIGMLDDGFNYHHTHTALKNVHVEAEYDFIHNIPDVDHQSWEPVSQGAHGTNTLSVIGGFDSGQLIGAAYGASFLLAKTEMDSSGNVDFHSEEDTYVAGLEWAERLGADITSSSVAYKQFTSAPSYTTAEMNGRTTKVAQAAVIAARKGVLVVTCMGNEGYISGKGSQTFYADTTLWSPADADSIIAVGATSSDGELAAFSGCGPSADGRIKPELVAQGMGVYMADGYSPTVYQYANGTSYSTPLTAGAAALILSTHPELTNMQVRQALLATAAPSNAVSAENIIYPNNYYGYGFVDAYAAALYFGPVFSNEPKVTMQDFQFIVSTFIVSNSGIMNDSVFFYYNDNAGLFKRVRFQPTNVPNEYRGTIPNNTNAASMTGYFSLSDNAGRNYRYPAVNAPRPLLTLTTTLPERYMFFQNYPNPFNGGTTLSFDAPVEEPVEVTVFNLLGQRIRTLFDGRTPVGTRTIYWDGTNEQGFRIASGMYIARLKTSSAVFTQKMLFLR